MEALKAAGNDAVRKGEYKAAVDLYTQAIASLHESQIEELSVLSSNCSFAWLKLGRNEEVTLLTRILNERVLVIIGKM